jgi:hypothetical protein
MKSILKNKKGNAFLGVVVALIVWFGGILIFPFLTDDITTFRSALDCTNTSITGGTMINCLYGDIVAPFWIWTIFAIALGYIAGSKR